MYIFYSNILKNLPRCDRIICMNIHIDKKIKLTLITLLCLLVAVCTGGFFCVQKTAKADQSIKYTAKQYLPQTNLEQYDLSSPIFTYHDDEVTAIVQSNQKLVVYYKGQYAEVENFDDLKQVHKLNSNTLLVLDRAVLYTLDLDNLTANKTAFMFDGKYISGSSFDFNGEYLVLPFNFCIEIYKVEDGRAVENSYAEGCSDKPVVALNDLGDMFFIDNNGDLAKLPVVNPRLSKTVILENVSIDHMVATNTHLYYIANKTIYMLDLETNLTTPLKVVKDENYDLGQLLNPTNLSLKGDNLLITDNALEAVQEFEIVDDTLVFTGFAIAKEKTAYNRIQSVSIGGDVQKLGNKVAVLGENKLSIITLGTDNLYAPENYVNFIFGEDNALSKDTNLFALGKQKILCVETPKSSAQRVVMLNADGSGDATEINLDLESYHVNNLTYQNGKFYILTNNAPNSIVYCIDENSLEANATEIYRAPKDGTEVFSFIEVDVFQNIYLAKANQIVKVENTENGYSPTTATLPAPNGLIKMQTDLAGALFVLDSEGLKALNQTNDAFVAFEQSENLGKLTSFAIDFIDKDVYLLIEGKETIFTCNDLPNLCINDIAVPVDDYITTGNSANLSNLNVYKVKANANVYKVELLNNNFTYKQTISPLEEYLLICPVEVDNGFTKCVFYALAGQDQIVLVNKVDCEQVQIDLSPAPEKAFVTVGVNMYYMPIITPDSEYALTEQTVIRLDKGVEIRPQSLITIFGKDFYFATAEIDGKEYSGYVPVAFTVEVLSKDFAYEDYTIKTVKETTLYQDQALSTALIELKDDQQVKVLWVKDGIAFVKVQTDSGEIEGYIDANQFTNHPKKAIRNSILIIVVATSIFATSTYFILRKKEKN